MYFNSRAHRFLAPAALFVAGHCLPTPALADTFSEGFDAGVPASWSQQNNSAPVGAGIWAQGVAGLSPAHSGAVNSFVVANFQSGSGAATLSNWLWTPTLTVTPASVLTFYTRTGLSPATFPDRLEVRWSDAASPSPGTAATDVGSFDQLLLAVNPGLTSTGYPAEWTAYTVSFSGLSAPSTGNLAFRYFVTDGGPGGSNSSIVGLDTLSITNTVPEPGSYALMAIGVLALGLFAKASRRI